MFKSETMRVRKNGDSRFDASLLKGDTVTVYIDGEFGGASLDLVARGGQIQCPVYDGSNITEGTQDGRGSPARRIVIAGRMDELIVRARGATAATDLRVAVV